MAKNRYTRRTTICGQPTDWRPGVVTQSPQSDRWDSEPVRARKQQASTEERKAQNRRRATRKLESLLFSNFNSDNMVLTLTFAPGQEPQTEKQVKDYIRYFCRKVRRKMKKLGLVLRYIYITENLHGDGEEKGRLHYHMILNLLWRREEHRQLVQSCWPYGKANWEAVRVDAAGCPEFAALANYWHKERQQDIRKVGSRSWIPSKNLIRPQEVKEIVDGFEELEAPADAIIIERQQSELGYGVAWGYLIYLLPPQVTLGTLSPSRTTPPLREELQTFLG